MSTDTRARSAERSSTVTTSRRGRVARLGRAVRGLANPDVHKATSERGLLFATVRHPLDV